MLPRIVKINAGGRVFQTTVDTLCQYPGTSFAKLFTALTGKESTGTSVHRPGVTTFSTSPPSSLFSSASALCSTLPTSAFISPSESGVSEEIFLDVCPRVFERVLNFLRTKKLYLPVDDLSLRGDLIHQLQQWDLLDRAFPSSSEKSLHRSEEGNEVGKEDEKEEAFPLPDLCTVQILDNMSIEAGVKRHALTVTYGCDGFELRELTRSIRQDLHPLLSSTYWQVHQTGERSVFFATTRVADGAAALLTTSIQQQVVTHTESMGYTLVSSNVTISPDPVHVSVRLLLQQLIFRRARLHVLDPGDMEDVEERAAFIEARQGEDGETTEETFQNFEPRHVGPRKTIWSSINDSSSEEERPCFPSDEERCKNFFPR